MNAIAELIAELVQDLTDMTKRYEQAASALEKYREEAEHWRKKYQSMNMNASNMNQSV